MNLRVAVIDNKIGIVNWYKWLNFREGMHYIWILSRLYIVSLFMTTVFTENKNTAGLQDIKKHPSYVPFSFPIDT